MLFIFLEKTVKKLLLTFLILLTTLNFSFAEYNLSVAEKKSVNTVISKFNTKIKKNWDIQKKIYINIIQRIKLRKNLTEKQKTILQLLLDWLWYKPDKKTYSVKNSNSLFDEESVRKYWIDLLNWVRKWVKLKEYSYEKSLDISSKKWSDLAIKRWEITHKVHSWDSYYDYSKKVAWMKQNWVICKNIKRATFSESIAWWEFYCNKKDCTSEIKKAVKRSFDFFVWEKGKAYDLHYKAIVHPYFQTMWLWLSIQNKWKNRYRIYLTNHYCTTNIKK